jgi:hypothetical protein
LSPKTVPRNVTAITVCASKIAGCMVVETLRLSDAEGVHDQLGRELGASADIGIYRLLCELVCPAG